MIPASSSSAISYDPRLLEAVEEIRAAREAGEPPERELLLARYPDLAPELGRLFDTLEAVRGGGREDLLLKTVGNYHLLTEVARGGMGVIYQAVQLDLGRPVALKVLGTGAHASTHARQRFRQEAAVAAQLHHTHIVPVFGTACAEGQEAYAMPFIDGPSLADALRDLQRGEGRHPVSQDLVRLHRHNRPAYYRQVAELARQAADALAYAHQHGVLHRDVKPANLLVERGLDGRPHLWLNDFGLARLAGTDDFARPGESFGTRGYQSPEQTAGRVESIDERSDVFSLGVTLFELLTLQRPDEAGVPGDLALIVARCRQPRPEDRYASAAALADDLHRFLHDYPVRARRPGWRQHLLKWGKRHRRPLTAAACSFLLTALLGAGLLARAYQGERTERQKVEEREELAARAIAIYSPLVDDVLLATPGMREKQLQALEQACEVHERLVAARPANIARQRRLAQVSWRLGRVLTHLGRHEEAEARYRQSLELYEGLAGAEPEEPLHRLDLIRGLELWSGSLLRFGRKQEAAAATDRMLAQARQAAEDFPNDLRVRDALACYACAQGRFLLMVRQDPRGAEALFREGLVEAMAARTNHYRSLNQVYGNQRWLAVALDRQGKLDEALHVGRAGLATMSLMLDGATRGEGPSQKMDLYSYNQEKSSAESEQLDRLIRKEKWAEAEALVAASRQGAERYAKSNPDFAARSLKHLEQVEARIVLARKKGR